MACAWIEHFAKDLGKIRGGDQVAMLNLRRLRYFLFVGRELHYGRAAALLHLSQPALSQQISILEDELGTSLLLRDRRRVERLPQARHCSDMRNKSLTSRKPRLKRSSKPRLE